MTNPAENKLPVLATLWIGSSLSFLEVMCLKSMLRQGHHVVLYSYQDVANVPEGVECRDANEIFAPGVIFVHERTKTPAIHADMFRLRLLQKTDYIWVDADVLFLKPLTDAESHVFAWEFEGSIGNSILRLPRSSEALAFMWQDIETLLEQVEDKLQTGQLRAFNTPYEARSLQVFISTFGPKVVTAALQKSGEITHARPKESFYLFGIGQVRNFVLRPQLVLNAVTEATIGLHLWSSRLDNAILARDDERIEKSFIGKMCRDLEIDRAQFPLHAVEESYHAVGAERG